MHWVHLESVFYVQRWCLLYFFRIRRSWERESFRIQEEKMMHDFYKYFLVFYSTVSLSLWSQVMPLKFSRRWRRILRMSNALPSAQTSTLIQSHLKRLSGTLSPTGCSHKKKTESNVLIFSLLCFSLSGRNSCLSLNILCDDYISLNFDVDVREWRRRRTLFSYRSSKKDRPTL